jgi:hypothetical protein
VLKGTHFVWKQKWWWSSMALQNDLRNCFENWQCHMQLCVN